MSDIEIIQTTDAPNPVGTYSQAVGVGNTIYLSGQIGLDPSSMELADTVSSQAKWVFKNLQAIAKSSGGDLTNFVKLNVYLTDLSNFAIINDLMKTYFSEPYPARAMIQVSALPMGAQVEVDGIMVL